MRRNWLRSRQC